MSEKDPMKDVDKMNRRSTIILLSYFIGAVAALIILGRYFGPVLGAFIFCAVILLIVLINKMT